MVLAACAPPEAIDGPSLGFDFVAQGFYAAPFPSDHRRAESGKLALTDFPNPDKIEFVATMRRLVSRDAIGFGVSSGIFFSVSESIDGGALPTSASSVLDGATAFLVGLDDGPDAGKRYPVDVTFDDDPGPFAAERQLTMLPLQGVPLRPRTRYAAVVLRAAANLGVPAALVGLLDGVQPDGMSNQAFETYRRAVGQLAEQGLDVESIAGLAVFTTGDPERTLTTAFEATSPPPIGAPFAHRETYDDFCVFESHVDMPVFQTGRPPFNEEGGGWTLDDAGSPMQQGTERARVFVTLPRRAPPAGGFPGVVFIRTGGGGDRPLIDRGVRTATGAMQRGTGPARELAQIGFAGVMVDGPHGGIRNVTGGDEQLLIFNFFNPTAMRDNIRQSALEVALVPALIAGVTISATACPGLDGPAGIDVDRLALMGHSMGATIGPLSLAIEPRFRAMVLSGAGGSWIENIIRKQSPLVVRPLAELILEYEASGRTLTRTDPALNLLQWAGEPADPPIYGRRIIREPGVGAPRHVLMLQGIVDTYILPEIANATTLSFGLDLAGEPLEATVEAVLPLVGGEKIPLPVSGNIGGTTTAVVIQHREDGIEDGHEVVFQTEAPKRQYRGFLSSFARGEVPTVPR